MGNIVWPDGSKNHTISWTQHQANLAGGTVAIGNTPVTQAQWQSGALANALAPGSYPATTPQPIDPNLAIQGLGAQQNIAVANATAAQQTGDLGYSYGYNPDGTVSTANPYSKAALFEEAYNNQNRGAQNSMDVWGGSYQNQLGINAHTYAINEDQNKQAYMQGIHGIQQTQNTTTAANQTGLAAAGLPSLLNQTSGA